MTTQVYVKLGRHAEDVLAGGYDVIVDATFGRREDRAAFRQLAERLGVGIWLINCHAPLETLRARIGARRKAGAEASEADKQVLDWQIRQHDALDADEAARALSADTTNPAVDERVAKELDARRAVT